MHIRTKFNTHWHCKFNSRHTWCKRILEKKERRDNLFLRTRNNRFSKNYVWKHNNIDFLEL